MNRKTAATLLAQCPTEARRYVLKAILWKVPQFDRSKDHSFRGIGNKFQRRAGWIPFGDPSYRCCSADYSPCDHEYYYWEHSQRIEEHGKRRGIKTKGGSN